MSFVPRLRSSPARRLRSEITCIPKLLRAAARPHSAVGLCARLTGASDPLLKLLRPVAFDLGSHSLFLFFTFPWSAANLGAGHWFDQPGLSAFVDMRSGPWDGRSNSGSLRLLMGFFSRAGFSRNAEAELQHCTIPSSTASHQSRVSSASSAAGLLPLSSRSPATRRRRLRLRLLPLIQARTSPGSPDLLQVHAFVTANLLGKCSASARSSYVVDFVLPGFFWPFTHWIQAIVFTLGPTI